VTLRRLRRAVALALALLFCLFRYWLSRLRGPLTPERHAAWSHSSALLVIKLLGIRLKVTDQPPRQGLVVSNHLGYLDILAYYAAMPSFLVSKAEIGRWPFFGTLARAAGTLFIDRANRASAQAVSAQIGERLQGGIPVLFFPEGTSTDGSQVLRFHSRLFEPAIATGTPITAAAIRYFPANGAPERALCWFGDDLFLPHILRTLAAPDCSVRVHFGEPRVYADRRDAASQTQAEVTALRAQPPLP
jgi:1-acyl-sn-glycerol-3-phosphate acyltransferase